MHIFWLISRMSITLHVTGWIRLMPCSAKYRPEKYAGRMDAHAPVPLATGTPVRRAPPAA